MVGGKRVAWVAARIGGVTHFPKGEHEHDRPAPYPADVAFAGRHDGQAKRGRYAVIAYSPMRRRFLYFVAREF